MATLSKLRLANDIADVLELPHAKGHGLAYDLVGHIIKTMTEALQAGETVDIKGFGKFKLRTRKPTKSIAFPITYMRMGGAPYMVNLPAKTYVHFTPSKHLLRTLNGTCDQ